MSLIHLIKVIKLECHSLGCIPKSRHLYDFILIFQYNSNSIREQKLSPLLESKKSSSFMQTFPRLYTQTIYNIRFTNSLSKFLCDPMKHFCVLNFCWIGSFANTELQKTLGRFQTNITKKRELLGDYPHSAARAMGIVL